MVHRRLIEEFGRGPRIRIVTWLKRSGGLSVRELAGRLGMSYMGIKQHCVELHEAGYLETWRRPRAEGRPLGRPELVYRLTPRAQELFPAAGNRFTLDLLREARTLYGPAAPEKLILALFRRRTDDLRARVRGDRVETRARWLCREREKEGHLADVISQEGRLAIEEHHSPLAGLLESFPVIGRLEQELFAEVLGVPVRREVSGAGGLTRCRFVTAEPYVPSETLL